jgi:hypothetical protein
MRNLLFSLAVVVGLFLLPHPDSSGGAVYAATVAASSAAAPALDQQPPQINVEIQHGSRAWYLSPVWIAIGALAIIVLVLLIVMAARGGGGTTIVKE